MKLPPPFSGLSTSLLLACLLAPAMNAADPVQVLTLQEWPEGQPLPRNLASWQRSLTPEGRWRVLRVEPEAQQEGGLALPPGQVRWIGLYPEELTQTAPSGLQIIGNLSRTKPVVDEVNAAAVTESAPAEVAIEEVSALNEIKARLPLPAGMNVAGLMEWTPFGIEERVIQRETAETTWDVRSGVKPAGLYSATRWHIPAWPRARGWQVELALKGSGEVEIGCSLDRGAGFPDPEVLGRIRLSEAGSSHTFDLPSRAAQARGVRLTLASLGAADGWVEVSEAVFQPNQVSAKASAPPKPMLGVWDWSTNHRRWQKMRPLWKEAGIKVLQLALPRGELSDEVRSILTEMRQEGFQVVAVEGDPHMILAHTRESVVERLRQLAGWKGSALDAAQYDVEPYLLPGFGLQQQRWHENWGSLFESLAKASPMPVEAVVPFWLLGVEHSGSVLQSMAENASRVVTMNYRSDPVEAAAWATAWLEWSAVHQCPVSLAIECGPIEDTRSFSVRKAEAGRLWVSPWPGKGTAVVLYENDVSATAPAFSLAQVREAAVPGSRTTMRGQPAGKVAELIQNLYEIARAMQLPERLMPVILLHEPENTLLEQLGD